MVINLADIGNRFQKWLASRFGVLAAVVVDRGDHIIGRQGFTVVKRHVPAQAEGPDIGARTCLPRLGQLRNRFAVMVDLCQAVANRAHHEVVDHPGAVSCGIERFSGAATSKADAKVTPLFRGLGMRDGFP